jgi:hypothetical protein
MKGITLWIFSIAFLTACTSEFADINRDFEEPTPEAPDASKCITLVFPDADEVSLGTYSPATSSECYIDSVWVLEFNTSGALINDTLIKAANIYQNGYQTQLLPQLPFEVADGNRLVLVANTYGITSLPTGLIYGNLDSKFELRYKMSYNGGDHLPMYGEIYPYSNTTNIVCNMTRAVAKVQVQMGTNPYDVTGVFKPDNVSYEIVNIPIKGYVHTFTQFDPGVDTMRSSTHYLLQKSNPAPTEAQQTVYLHEYPNATRVSVNNGIPSAISNKVFTQTRTYILITNTGVTPNTYYRLDFYDRKDSVFIDIQRNHHYLFTINKIGSAGYTDIQDVQVNPGSNIEYTITANASEWNTIASNGQYAIALSAKNDTIWVPSVTSTTTADILNLKWINGSSYVPSPPLNVNSIAVVIGSVDPSSGDFTIAPTSFPTLSNTVARLNATRTAAFKECKIEFKFGNITHRCVVKKRP